MSKKEIYKMTGKEFCEASKGVRKQYYLGMLSEEEYSRFKRSISWYYALECAKLVNNL